uniref:Uncharacterized protein n=1 Tax=Chromera velia CCMP2878 TaxID=1169474 RepID=A0A0G4HI33_9ALVE|eukprot:Cvel_6914.t1-p1 / transcript=Cvel_6914.t1 / gene=Cvel_6914 / organism=Chromera_velia_CCMP2878 / gene_product=hypothetical protein / transcript_product=hypothetical protein / location=Cvel_scaffold349:92645-93970(-) / protein_length=210 / sequence_SO=supercontig / SO=protein_coding / is_pseudo=false
MGRNIIHQLKSSSKEDAARILRSEISFRSPKESHTWWLNLRGVKEEYLSSLALESAAEITAAILYSKALEMFEEQLEVLPGGMGEINWVDALEPIRGMLMGLRARYGVLSTKVHGHGKRRGFWFKPEFSGRGHHEGKLLKDVYESVFCPLLRKSVVPPPEQARLEQELEEINTPEGFLSQSFASETLSTAPALGLNAAFQSSSAELRGAT